MFLTASNLVHYLIARGLLTAESVVNGDFITAEAGRRNRNYKVMVKNGTGLFVKQIRNFDASSIATLQKEAACYRIAWKNSGYGSMSAIMARLVDHDAGRHCLVIELIAGGENLNEYYARNKSFPVEIGRTLGKSMGDYHLAMRGKTLQPEEAATFPRQTPWILSYHNSTSFPPGSTSGGVMQLVGLVRQYPDLHYNLERLRSHWSYDSIIHGDIKWDNCIVSPDGNGGLKLKVVDWEIVDYGDACWDVGAVLQSFLTTWICSMPLANETSPERLVNQAGCSLESMYPAIKAFWRGYLESSGIPRQQACHYLIRSVEYGAARMVQTVFESLVSSPCMTSFGATMLQVSLNILRNPKEAAVELYGLMEDAA